MTMASRTTDHVSQGTTMSTNFYLGQITMAGYNFAPRGFALCNGQLLPISQNQALFSLLGLAYGGNGTTNFALPNMQGRVPVGQGPSSGSGQNYPIGSIAGAENVTLTASQLAAHMHSVNASTTTARATTPSGGIFASVKPVGTSAAEAIYGPMSNPAVALAQTTVTPAGGNGPHPNMQPYSVINFTIALQGIFPSRS